MIYSSWELRVFQHVTILLTSPLEKGGGIQQLLITGYSYEYVRLFLLSLTRCLFGMWTYKIRRYVGTWYECFGWEPHCTFGHTYPVECKTIHDKGRLAS